MAEEHDRSMMENLYPAVANLQAGETGFDIDEAVELVRSVRGLNIIGGDLVCMTPTMDSANNITALAGGAVMFEMISMIAQNIASK